MAQMGITTSLGALRPERPHCSPSPLYKTPISPYLETP